MLKKSDISDCVTNQISQEFDIIVLRGVEVETRKGGDIDFLVPQGTAKRAAKLVCELATRNGWGVYGTHDLGYVVQICLIIPGEVPCEDISVKLDFSNGLSWYNLGTDKFGNALFEMKRSGVGVAKLAKIASFFQKVLYPGYLRPKDVERIRSDDGMGHVQTFCATYGANISKQEIETGTLKTKTKWALRIQSASANKAKSLWWFSAAIMRALESRFKNLVSPTIITGVSGMDGSGKSTLIDRFVAAIKDSEFAEPKLVHLLPPLIPMPHQIFKKKSTKENYTNPYSSPPVKSKLNAALRTSYYAIAFTFSKIWCAYKTRRGHVIIFDRSFVDFSSDLSRARIPHFEVPNFLIRKLLPSGLFFYLDASPATVVDRKGELKLDKATTLSANYNRVVDGTQVRRLNGEQAMNDVYRDFLRTVTDEVARRGLKT